MLSAAVWALIYLGITFFTDGIIAVFNSENNRALRDYAASGLVIYFSGFAAAGLNIIITAFLSAAESSRAAFVLSMTRGFAAIVPLVLVLPHFWGIIGVWLVFPVAESLTLALAVKSLLVQRKLSSL